MRKYLVHLIKEGGYDAYHGPFESIGDAVNYMDAAATDTKDRTPLEPYDGPGGHGMDSEWLTTNWHTDPGNALTNSGLPGLNVWKYTPHSSGHSGTRLMAATVLEINPPR
jgi:hypothetical protein